MKEFISLAGCVIQTVVVILLGAYVIVAALALPFVASDCGPRDVTPAECRTTCKRAGVPILEYSPEYGRCSCGVPVPVIHR